jgi:hypothetical protein
MVSTSGATFHIQVKGTESELNANSDGTFIYNMKKNALYFAEQISTSFFLFSVDVSKSPGKVYFSWIQ